MVLFIEKKSCKPISFSFDLRNKLQIAVVFIGDCFTWHASFEFLKAICNIESFQTNLHIPSSVSICRIRPTQLRGEAFPGEPFFQLNKPADYDETCPFLGLH